MSTPYVQAQLMATDPNNDRVQYIIDSPPSGAGYEEAFIDSQTGRAYVKLNSQSGTVSIGYKATDGQAFSPRATLTINVGASQDPRGVGAEETDSETYAGYDTATYDGDRLGSADGNATLPARVDLSSLFPGPGDQGRQGSCVGWATAYALKSFQEKIEVNWDYSTSTVFSPAWIYNQINGGVDQGSNIGRALELIKTRGAATFATMPYDATNFTRQPSSAAVNEAMCYRAASWSTVRGSEQIKAALANRQPVVLGMRVFSNFQMLRGPNSVYNSASGSDRGGHAVTIVGYDDSRFGGAYRVINSWGTGWGDNGYFWLPYSFGSAEVIREAYTLVDAGNTCGTTPPAPTRPMPPAESLPDLQIASWRVSQDERPGGAGEFTYDVINAGRAVAPRGADINFLLTKDQVLDNSDIYVVYEDIPVDLRSGGSVVRNSNNPLRFNLPETLPEGDYFIAAWVDDLDEVRESSEGNNKSVSRDIASIESSLPDLVVDSWFASWSNTTGQGTLEYKVTNAGRGFSSQTSWDINLILSRDERVALGEEIYLFFEDGNFQLAPGGSVSRGPSNSASFSIFTDAFGDRVPDGSYYMALWVDDLEEVEESNELNNSSFGNNLVSVRRSSSSSAIGSALEKSSLDEMPTASFNGRHLPDSKVMWQKVEIAKNTTGQPYIKTLGKPELKQADGAAVTQKVHESANHVVFPRAEVILMPQVPTRSTFK